MVINLIRSETWLSDNYEYINLILNETIKEFVDDNDDIINIQVKTDSSGLSRFWVYTSSEIKGV